MIDPALEITVRLDGQPIIRLPARAHMMVDPLTFTVMFTKLPIAVESIGVELPAARNELALRARLFPDRFFFAMIILGAGQAAFAA